jgi:lipid-binding SYLF domain-containing protein
MSVNKLGIILFSSFLIFATAPTAPAQNTQYPKGEKQTGTTKKAKTGTAETVKKIQKALSNREYYYGAINGVMNSKTKQAIREFQLLNNMPMTGAVDERLMVALDVRPVDTRQAQANEAQAGKAIDQESTRFKPGIEVEPGKVAGAETQSDTQRKTGDHGAYKHEDNRTADKNRDTANVDRADKEARERVEKAAAVLQALTSAEDKRIPNDLLERAKAVAVIPNVLKGALGIGGRYGKGVVAQRMPDGRWSAPAFIQIGGGSFGAQIGVSSTDLVLVFTDAKALDLLMKGKDLKLGVDASVAAGPIGRSAEAGVNANLETAILAYSRSKGLFAGVALDGSVLDLDDSMNKKVYGEHVSAENILSGKVAANSTVRPFMDAISRIMPKQKISQR